MSTTRFRRPRGRAGMSLIEILVALVILSIVMGITLSVLRAQTRSFAKNGEQNDMLMNLRFATTQVDQVLRTIGTGTQPRQPMLVYADENTLVFNANYASDTDDGTAVNVNPDLPAGANTAMRTTAPVTIPGTAITYPTVDYNLLNGTPSRAETVMFFFRPDSTTAAADDFILFQRVNAEPPEVVARGLERMPGRDFFEYFTETVVASVPQVQQVTRTRVPGLPIRHTDPQHGAPTDVGASALADSIRTVRLNVAATNGLAGAAHRQRQASVSIRLANNGLVQLQTCGDDPIFTTALTATPNTAGNPPAVTLRWDAAVDEAAGELDIQQYNVYFRRAGTTEWFLFATVPPAGQPTYEITQGNGLQAGLAYEFGVAAQDCSPRESSLRLSPPTTIN